jgi:hypothetical protein
MTKVKSDFTLSLARDSDFESEGERLLIGVGKSDAYGTNFR